MELQILFIIYLHQTLVSNVLKRFSTQNTDEKEKKLILFQSVIEPV